MFYVPCRLSNNTKEYFLRIRNIEDTFKFTHVILNNKKIKIDMRGIPESYIDLFISKRINKTNILEGI